MTIPETIVDASDSFTIRQFSPYSDLEKVTKINRATLPENYPDSFYLLIYSSFPEGFLVVEDNTKHIVAYTMNRIETGLSNFSRLRRTKKGHVISIAVLPQARRKGLALRLMDLAMEEMKRKDASECYLEVRSSNEPAIALYEGMGFQIIKTLKKYYSDNESAYLMAKRL
jgi:ribosomal-protein-alanine N-acetyltransferase